MDIDSIHIKERKEESSGSSSSNLSKKAIQRLIDTGELILREEREDARSKTRQQKR